MDRFIILESVENPEGLGRWSTLYSLSLSLPISFEGVVSLWSSNVQLSRQSQTFVSLISFTSKFDCVILQSSYTPKFEDCVILQSLKICIAYNARVSKHWPTTPKYDVAEITTFVTSRYADVNVNCEQNQSKGPKMKIE